jgi:hypothetical protein
MLGDKVVSQTNIPLIDEGKLTFLLEGILEVNFRKLCIRQITKYKIKWRGLPKEEATRELEAFLVKHPSLVLL